MNKKQVINLLERRIDLQEVWSDDALHQREQHLRAAKKAMLLHHKIYLEGVAEINQEQSKHHKKLREMFINIAERVNNARV